MSRSGWLAPAFRAVAHWLDESRTQDQIRAFLPAGLMRLGRQISSQAESLDPTSRDEFARACRLARALGLEAPELPGSPERPPDSSALQAWIASLPNGRVLDAHHLIPESGEKLLSLLESPMPELASALDQNLELLLRHVEIRRKTSLALPRPSNQECAWMAKHAIAILFARAARLRGDLRLLNAAMKLNDWAYPAHRRLRAGPRWVRYLLALAEQETALAEALD